MSKLEINYTAEYTPSLFHADDSFVRGLWGPIGSSKSVSCCLEALSRCMRQEPDSQGRRRSRGCIIRNTFPELRTTTIKTWSEWIPEDICPIVYNSPIEGKLSFPMPDGTRVEAEIYFMAMDKDKDVKKLLSLELTWAFVNEAREVKKSIINAVTSRLGRYPAKKDGGPTWSGLFMDSNFFDDEHYLHYWTEVAPPDGWKFWRQPGALTREMNNGVAYYKPNPEAENVVNQPLGYDYWLRMLPGKDEEWIKVMILAEYGSIIDGRPVYPEWLSGTHVSEEILKPMRGLPIILGFDFGLTPACCFCQFTPKGQFRIINELVSEDMGIKRFAEQVVKPHIFNNFPGMKIVGYGDPAGNQRAQTDEKTCLQILNAVGIPTVAAPSNNFTDRREAVANLLTSQRDGEPCFIVSPNCKNTIKGFNGGYQYRKLQVAGEDRFTESPNKNSFSHLADSIQYACSGVGAFDLSIKYVKQPKRKIVVSTTGQGGWA